MLLFLVLGAALALPLASIQVRDVHVVASTYPHTPASIRAAVAFIDIDYGAPVGWCGDGSGPVTPPVACSFPTMDGAGQVDALLHGSVAIRATRRNPHSITVPIVVAALPPVALNESSALEHAWAVAASCEVLPKLGVGLMPACRPLPPVDLRHASLDVGDPVTLVSLTGLPDEHVVSQFTATPDVVREQPAHGGPPAFVEVAMAEFLKARLPGLADIITPIVQGVMSPVTDQFMVEVGSSLTERINGDLDEGVGAQGPLDIATCLNHALTYNLTNLVGDGTIGLVNEMLTPKLSEHLTPIIRHTILSLTGVKTLAMLNQGLSPIIAKRVASAVLERVSRSIPVPLAPALSQALSRTLALSLGTMLAHPDAPKTPPNTQLSVCAACLRGVKLLPTADCAACYQHMASLYETYYAAYYSEYYANYFSEYYGEAVKGAMVVDWTAYKTAEPNPRFDPAR